MRFFQRPVLRHTHCIRAGGHRQLLLQLRQRVCGHVFKFSADGGTHRGHLRQAVRVQVSGLNMRVADQTSGAVRVRVQHGGAVTQALRGMRPHACELTAAQHA